MDKKSNMKKAMYEMFGVGGDGSEAASTAPAQVKSASVEVKSAPGAEKKSVDHAPVKTPEARPVASFLAPGTVFEGSFRAKGDIEIAGELKGDVTSEGSVLLRSNLQSNITAGSVKLTGCTLIGDITANGGNSNGAGGGAGLPCHGASHCADGRVHRIPTQLGDGSGVLPGTV